jgi:hypothetical protein
LAMIGEQKRVTFMRIDERYAVVSKVIRAPSAMGEPYSSMGTVPYTVEMRVPLHMVHA